MKVGDLVRRRVNYGVDKGIGIVVVTRVRDVITGHGKNTLYCKVEFLNSEDFPMWYEEHELEVISESW